MIRKCTEADFEAVYEIINDSAEAYRGSIPADRWHEPYMSREQLKQEIDAGVSFWGFEEDGALIGVMGMQDREDVTLIRHSYVRSRLKNCGIGSRLLQFLQLTTEKPFLIGKWAH